MLSRRTHLAAVGGIGIVAFVLNPFVIGAVLGLAAVLTGAHRK